MIQTKWYYWPSPHPVPPWWPFHPPVSPQVWYYWPFPIPIPPDWPFHPTILPPAKPGVPTVRFDPIAPVEKDGKIVANAIGTVVPSPAVASDQDTDMTILVALNNNPATALDAGAPPGTSVTFPCVIGDTYVITQVDVNVVGSSAASNALTGTVALSPPTAVPTTPGQPTVSFAPAP